MRRKSSLTVVKRTCVFVLLTNCISKIFANLPSLSLVRNLTTTTAFASPKMSRTPRVLVSLPITRPISMSLPFGTVISGVKELPKIWESSVEREVYRKVTVAPWKPRFWRVNVFTVVCRICHSWSHTPESESCNGGKSST